MYEFLDLLRDHRLARPLRLPSGLMRLGSMAIGEVGSAFAFRGRLTPFIFEPREEAGHLG